MDFVNAAKAPADFFNAAKLILLVDVRGENDVRGSSPLGHFVQVRILRHLRAAGV